MDNQNKRRMTVNGIQKTTELINRIIDGEQKAATIYMNAGGCLRDLGSGTFIGMNKGGMRDDPAGTFINQMDKRITKDGVRKIINFAYDVLGGRKTAITFYLSHNGEFKELGTDKNIEYVLDGTPLSKN
jgi:hypothetical protein